MWEIVVISIQKKNSPLVSTSSLLLMSGVHP